MHLHYLVTDAHPGWTDEVPNLVPGAHVAVLADADADLVGVDARAAGLEFRDTLLVLRAGPKASFVLLLRKPLVEGTIVEQVLATGTGAMNIDACRASSEGNTTTARARGTRSRKYWRTGVIVGKAIPSSLGRWPTNLVIVHSTDCAEGGCAPTCPLANDHLTATDAHKYYPQLRTDTELLSWLHSLIRPE